MTSCFKGKFKVTSPRGNRVLSGKTEYHPGLDLVGIDSTKIYSIADGTVDATPYEQNGFGYYVRQKLDDGRRIYYGHMKKGSIAVKQGQRIRKGDYLGVMGSTGKSTGAHTHLEIRVAGTSKQSLDISAFTEIPNKIGTYEEPNITPDKVAAMIQKKCGFEDKTMDFLKTYKYADSLLMKLWEAIK